ncbi:MAG TPA: hypothetical protein VMY43_07270 [Methanothrix sp.]|nr:hypothetical protein [Methanothrix sp.]
MLLAISDYGYGAICIDVVSVEGDRTGRSSHSFTEQMTTSVRQAELENRSFGWRLTD